MKKLLFICLVIFLAAKPGLAQDQLVNQVSYARTIISVPEGYAAKDEYSIENKSFSAQWLYLTREMVDQGIDKQILLQIEQQLNISKSVAISFVSNGGKFAGKNYKLKGNGNIQYRVLAFGEVDGQLLVLNLGFAEDPKGEELFDDLMKRFIQEAK